MEQQPLMARKIKMETNGRCDYDFQIIRRGNYASQIIGDPETVKCQGLYHGRQCYEMALQHYNEKTKNNKLREGSVSGE